MLWLGEQRGHLLDWLTQRWVRLTGRRIDLQDAPWLDGPAGATRRIGRNSLEAIARRDGLAVRRSPGPTGVLPCFERLRGPSFDPGLIDPDVRAFYESTSAYELDLWSEWSGPFRPWGRLLAVLFGRRLQQLNVPLSPLDASRGVTSEVLPVMDPAAGELRYTAWVRELVGTGHTMYAGAYGVCRVPGHGGPCVRVTFPLPNGNAIVIMRPSAGPDGSLVLISSGERFGDPGFYFTVRAAAGVAWARYVPQFRERIAVYAAPGGPRADHVLSLWGATVLRLHYRLRAATRRPENPNGAAPSTCGVACGPPRGRVTCGRGE